jgi:hypothetical protein
MLDLQSYGPTTSVLQLVDRNVYQPFLLTRDAKRLRLAHIAALDAASLFRDTSSFSSPSQVHSFLKSITQ